MLLCTICHNLLWEPLACCSCDALVCKDCFKNLSDNESTCPSCENPFEVTQSAKWKNVVEVLLPLKIVKCKTCPKSHPYNDSRDHAYECSLQKRKCILGCGVPTHFVDRDGILTHYFDECPEMDLICPINDESLKRKMIDSHECVPKYVILLRAQIAAMSNQIKDLSDINKQLLEEQQ